MSNAETYVLGLTNRTANAIITNIAQEQAQNAGQPLKHRFTLRSPVGNATTELSLIKDPNMAIGIYGLFSLSGQVSDQQFIKTGIAIFHEFRHIEQDYQSKTGIQTPIPGQVRPVIEPEVIIANIAYRNNGQYYKSTYFHNVQEIDAEAYGVLATRKMLAVQFPHVPEVQRDELLLDVINDTNRDLKSKNYWLRSVTTRPISSIDQLKQAFQHAAEICLTKPKKSQFHKKPNLIGDEFYRVTQGSISVRNTWGPILYQFRRNTESGTGADFDRMLACVTLYARPDYMTKFKAAQDLDLSPQAVFGRDFPESQRSVMARLNISPNPIRTHRKKLLPKREPGKRILDDTRTFTDNVHAAKTSIRVWAEPSRTKTREDQLLEQQLRAKAQGLQQISPPDAELDDPTNPYN